MPEHQILLPPFREKQPSHTQSLLKTQITIFAVRLWNFACAHPAMASALIALAGGITLLTYFIPLGFVPDFDLVDVMGLLIAAALLGALQVLVLLMALLAPTMWYEWCLSSAKRSAVRHAQRKFTTVVLVATLCWLWLISYSAATEENWIGAILGASIAFLTACATLKILRPLAKYVVGFVFQGFICVIAILLLRPAEDSPLIGLPEWMQWIILGAWCVLISMANMTLARERRLSLKITVGVGAYLLFMLVLITHNSSFVHGMAVRTLGLGAITGVTLTVGNTGQAVLHAACQVKDAPPACEAYTFTNDDLSAYSYRDVTILSRIGRQYYIQLCQPSLTKNFCNTTEGLKVVLEKKDVFGWSRVGQE